MNIQSVASVAAIATDPEVSRRLYVDDLGLPLTHDEGDDYIHSESIDGCKHFGVWPLRQASRACFGTDEWPADVVVPEASLEFEFEAPPDVTAAADELEASGHALLHPPRLEPWG